MTALAENRGPVFQTEKSVPENWAVFISGHEL